MQARSRVIQRVLRGSPSLCRYYQKKLIDPSFHPGSHGGARNFRFPPLLDKYLKSELFVMVRENPYLSYHEMRYFCYLFLFSVTNLPPELDCPKRLESSSVYPGCIESSRGGSGAGRNQNIDKRTNILSKICIAMPTLLITLHR